MAILPILTAPDPRLKGKSAPVGAVDAETARLMDDMLETMYAAPGIGLAAPQVGVAKRLIVVDVGEDGSEDASEAGDGEPEEDSRRKPLKMADPELLWVSEELWTYEEGCLSVPEHYAEVERPARIKVRYRDETDTVRELEAENLLATCIQHEMDHLDGILFVDHLSSLKRGMILRKLTKAKKLAEKEARKAGKAEAVPA